MHLHLPRQATIARLPSCQAEMSGWLCTAVADHVTAGLPHVAFGTGETIHLIWPVDEHPEECNAQQEAADARAALDLADTRWDNLRGYVAELAARAAEWCQDAQTSSATWNSYDGQREVLAAVASFMDGQADGSVTRG